MKKISMLVLFLTVIFILISCAASETPETFSSDFVNEKVDLNYSNMLLKIFFSQTTIASYTPDIFMGYPEDSFFYELVKTRMSDIEKELNIRIEYNTVANNSSAVIQRDSFAGESEYGLCVDQTNSLFGAATTGMLTDLTLYTDYVDYTDTAKYGSREYLKGIMWNGGLYGVIPNKWPIVPFSSLMGLLCVNEKLIKQIGVTDPREYVESNTWDWDNFESQMKVYAHTNQADEYVYAFESSTHWLFTAMQVASGCGISYYENGQYNLSSHTDTAIDAFNRALDWTYGDYSPYMLRNESWGNIRQDFIDEKTVSAIVCASHILATTNSLVYELEDFAILSFPHGPNAAPDGTGACLWWSEGVTSIPTLFDEPELSALVINMLYEPLEGYETREKIDEYMRRYFLYDDRDVACLNHNFDTALYNYRNENLTDMIININNSKSVQAWLETYEAADEVNRAKYLEVQEETADLLYGNSYDQ